MNFLKKIFKKAEASETVALDELQGWFAKKTASFYSKIKEDLKENFREADGIREELEDDLIGLRKAKLQNPNVSTRELQILEGNKDLCIKKAMDLLNSTEFLGELDYDSLKKHAEESGKELAEFAQSTARAFYILNQFFGDEMGRISRNLARLEEAHGKLRKIVSDEDGLKTLKDAQDAITELTKLKASQERITDQLAEENSKLASQKAYLQRLERQKDDLENSDEYANLDGLRTMKVKLEKELAADMSLMADGFYQIEKALRKYQRTVDDMTAEKIERYLKDPVEALFEDNDFSVLDILNSMRSSIDLIETDDRRKMKIMESLQRLDESFLKERIARRADITSKISDVDARIKQDKIIRDIEDLNYKLNHAKSQIKRIEEEDMRILNAQLEKIDPAKLKERISSQIEKLTSIKVTISE